MFLALAIAEGKVLGDLKVLRPLGLRRLILESALIWRWTFCFFKKIFHISRDKPERSQQRDRERKRDWHDSSQLEMLDTTCFIRVIWSYLFRLTASMRVCVIYHFEAFHNLNVLVLCTLTGFVSGVMHRRIWTTMCACEWNIHAEVLRTLKRVEHKQHLSRREKSPQGVTARENEREEEKRIYRIIFIEYNK